MPRDFVPCMYHEWDMVNDVSKCCYRRYEVTEAFQMADRVTQEPFLTMTPDSHGSCVTTTQSLLDWITEPPTSREITRHTTRAFLFTDFYAAMAALE